MVYLKKDEKLDVHEHPIETLIIICNGSGRMLGDLEKIFMKVMSSPFDEVLNMDLLVVEKMVIGPLASA